MSAETVSESLLSKFLVTDINIHDVLVEILQIPDCVHMVNTSLKDHATKGILRVGEEVIHFSLCPDNAEVLIAVISSRKMNCLVKNGEGLRWIRDEDVDHSGIVDLDTTGKRWEGSVYESALFGYGKLFNESDHVVYEGFMRNNKMVCYGTQYYDDIDVPCYCGCFFNNQKCGMGYVVDRLGERGEAAYWNNNNRLGPNPKGGKTVIHSHSKSLTLNRTEELPSTFELGFEWMRSLKSLVIVRRSFKQVRHFKLENLPALRMLLVNPGCFQSHNEDYKVPARSDGEFIIRNCPLLTKVTIMPYSFADYSVMEMSDLPSLSELLFQYQCFHNAHRFVIKSWLVYLRLLHRLPLAACVGCRPQLFQERLGSRH